MEEPLYVGMAIIILCTQKSKSKVITAWPKTSAKSSIDPLVCGFDSANIFFIKESTIATGIIAKTMYCTPFIRLALESASKEKTLDTNPLLSLELEGESLSIYELWKEIKN